MKHKPRSKPETVKVGNVTVAIYKRRRRKANRKSWRTIYEVADKTNGARRLRDFTNHKQARAEANKIARALSNGAHAASYGRVVELLRPTGVALEKVAATYVKAFEILGGDAVIEAAKFYKRHRADQVKRKRVAHVVAELIALREKLTNKGKPGSARYIGDLRSRLDRFSKAFAVDISSITKVDVQRWLDALDAAPQTVKNFRTVLNTLFSYAESRGYIFKGSNPVDETEKISSHNGIIEIYKPKNVAALLDSAPRQFLPFVALGAFAGLRTGEIERLDWVDIDLKRRMIHVSAEKAKTASRRYVPILPNLAAWLSRFSGHRGKVWTGDANDLKALRAATVKAANTPWKGNGLRHSFISYRFADLQDAAMVTSEAGVSEKMILKHYRELAKPADAEAWFAVMPETLGGAK